jgi:hypothetical protein
MDNLSKSETRIYIDKFFIPLDNGTHAILKNGKYEIIDTPTLRSVYFKRMSKEANNYYFTEKKDIRSIVYDISKPVLTATELNLCPKTKHTYKNYDLFSSKTKKNVEKMLQHLRIVWSNNNEEIYKFLLKWLSNMIKGKKNTSCLYLKGPQGAGKSLPVEFIRFYVLGEPLCVETGSGPLKTKFNSELAGKLMVQFEELENFSMSEWMNISSVLKRIITSPTIMIEGKGKDSVEHININNYILLSNNDAIQDDDGRRYFILPINAKFIGNHDYFDDLCNSCFNDDVGHAFYCYMMELDTNNFNSQRYPLTSSKIDSFVKRLDNVFKFLKDTYILQKEDMLRIKVGVLHDAYLKYCTITLVKPKGKIDFCNTLKNIGINYFKSNDSNYYKQSLQQLESLADKYNWIHDLDEHKPSYPKVEPIKTVLPKQSKQELLDHYKQLLQIDQFKTKLMKEKLEQIVQVKKLELVKKTISVCDYFDKFFS